MSNDEFKVYMARMVVSAGLFNVYEPHKKKVVLRTFPTLVCSWWTGGWLVAIVMHGLQ
jgi:hypothetical protein